MQHREQELALREAAALRIESIERIAESRFDITFRAAEASGSTESVTGTPEFREWMAARADTDAAWGRWAEVMQGGHDASAAVQGRA